MVRYLILICAFLVLRQSAAGLFGRSKDKGEAPRQKISDKAKELFKGTKEGDDDLYEEVPFTAAEEEEDAMRRTLPDDALIGMAQRNEPGVTLDEIATVSEVLDLSKGPFNMEQFKSVKVSQMRKELPQEVADNMDDEMLKNMDEAMQLSSDPVVAKQIVEEEEKKFEANPRAKKSVQDPAPVVAKESSEEQEKPAEDLSPLIDVNYEPETPGKRKPSFLEIAKQKAAEVATEVAEAISPHEDEESDN